MPSQLPFDLQIHIPPRMLYFSCFTTSVLNIKDKAYFMQLSISTKKLFLITKWNL